MHRKLNRVEGGLVFVWLTAMLRPVSHMNRSAVPIPSSSSSSSNSSRNSSGSRCISSRVIVVVIGVVLILL